MNTIASPANYVTRQDEACKLLANLAYSISGKMPVTKNCDYNSLIPYLVNASSSWAKTFVGLEIPIPKRFCNFRFVKMPNEQWILSEQTTTWSLSLMENSAEVMDFVGNMTSKRGNQDAFCTAANGSESYLLPGDSQSNGALDTELTSKGDLIVNDVIIFSAQGNPQAATSARYAAVKAASKLVEQSISASLNMLNFQAEQHKIYSSYVQLEIIKQYCASLWLLKDAQSLTFAQSALESALACMAERCSPNASRQLL